MTEKVFLTILCEDEGYGITRSTVVVDNQDDAKTTAAFLDFYYTIPAYVSVGVSYEESEVVFLNEAFYEYMYSNEE